EAGVADNAEVRAVRLDIASEDLRTRRAVGDIELKNARGTPELLSFGSHRIRFFTARAAVNDDVEPITRKTQGDRAADAATRSRDEYRVAHLRDQPRKRLEPAIRLRGERVLFVPRVAREHGTDHALD